MSRPKKEETQKRVHRISIRLTDTELLSLGDKTQAAGMSMSNYLRKAVLSGRVVVRKNSDSVAVVSQLMKIGTNLNQLTRLAHIHGEYDREHLHSVLSGVQNVVMKLIDDSEN